MSDIDLIKQMTTQHFVAPLDAFRANTRGLDDTHTTHLNQFQNIIGSLFAPGVDFSGQAADAIAELVGKYLQAANALSDAKDGLSAKLADASRVCETTAAEISHDLAILPDTDPTQSAGGTFSAFVVLGQKLPLAWEIIIGTGLAAAATTYIIVNGEQQNVLDDMSRAEERWETDMLNVAMEAEPKLPPNPTDPKPFLASPGSILYLNPNLPPYNSMSQEQLLVEDIMRELQRLGITANQSDVENLVKLGYNRASIIFILSQSPRPPVGQIPSASVLLSAGASLDANGRTAAGRAFQKHGSRNPSIWGTPKGNQAALNKEGQDLLALIVNSPDTIWQVRHHARFGDVIEARLPDGRGARWSADGKTFIGFLNP